LILVIANRNQLVCVCVCNNNNRILSAGGRVCYLITSESIVNVFLYVQLFFSHADGQHEMF